MSQVIQKERLNDSEKSLNSNDEDNVKKKETKKVNFIQKNKILVQTNKNKSNSDIIIRCLNDDIDDSVKVITTVNEDDENNHLNNSNQIEFEISIISNHSSTISDLKLKENIKQQQLLVQGDEYKPESDLIFCSEYLKLNQQDSKENEVNIIKSDQDNKSKIRSQFMQRFGSLNHKRQITPNIIEQNDNKRTSSVECTPLSTMKTTADSSPSTLELKNHFSRVCNSYKINQEQDTLTTASIAASIAAMSVVNAQPFAKKQNDIDEKITNVLKELENMRKSDDKLFNKKKILENNELNEDISNKRHQEKESEFRIKHLEKLQEKQFDMMSQLINVIGTENSKADLIAHHGKENVKKFKKQINQISDQGEVEVDDDYEDYIKFTQNLNKNNKKKMSNNRSRNQNKEHFIKKRTNSDSKKKIESSRSRSGSRSCCRMRNSIQFRNSTESLDLKNKKTDFLEELLDSDHLLKIKPSTLTINTNLNDTQQPLLFDKYLYEVKNKFKENESCTNNEKNLNEQNLKLTDTVPSKDSLVKPESNSNLKESMFSDIQEVLKAVEHSKTRIDANLAGLARERDNKMFYLLNSNLDEENDRIRIRKMVDGCINAISDDVQKEVTQKLIDESKHIKLIAEKDNGPSRINRFIRTQNPIKNSKNILRSASAVDLSNTKKISQTNKYIGKLFGKSLLDQIKLEKSEEENKKLKQQILEQQKLKRDLEHRLQKDQAQKSMQQQRQTRISKHISTNNKTLNKKEPIKQIDEIHIPRITTNTNRSAFATTHFKPSYSHTNYSQIRPRSNDKNVALINISPVEISRLSPVNKPNKELIKQNLPSVNINPDQDTNSLDIKKDQNENNNDDDDANVESLDVNQTGSGIHLPGYRKIKKQNNFNFDRNNEFSQNSNLINDKHIHQLSNEASQMSKARDILENKTFDWLEQELMARFISKLANSEPHIHEENYQEFDESTDNESIKNEKININESDIMNAIGQEGFQLFVDIGQPVDPDLIQALVREVLEEKISSMAANKEILQEEKPNLINSTGPPMPSPRNININRKSTENLEEFYNLDVQTPIPTPSQSPPPTPIKPVLTPQISTEKNIQNNTPPVVIPQMPQITNLDEYEVSLLEETLQDEDNYELELDINENYESKSIEMVATPKETPAPSPIPQNDIETPIETSISEKTNSKPKVESPKLIPQIIQQRVIPPLPVIPVILQVEPRTSRSRSIQCDEPIFQRKPKTIQTSELSSSSNSSSSSLTESTQYNSEDASNTTISSKSNKKDDDEDSYFSEGAWLLSKSEGQIIPVKKNNYVNLDLVSATKSLALSPRKKENVLNVDTITSDGELKIENINSSEMFLYGNKQKNVVDNISRMPENGEVINSEKSDGEIENPGEISKNIKNEEKLNDKKILKLNSSSKCKKSSKSKADKTYIDLNISPAKYSINNIKIESISNQNKTKNSNDFERKLFSSTPDTTMNRVPSISNANYIMNGEEEFFDDYDSEEQEIEIDNSPRK